MNRLACFLSDEDGTVTIETVLIMPFLVWCYLATFVFFGAFHADATNVKATFTIADALSREGRVPITPEFIDSLYALQRELTGMRDRSLRITVVRYEQESDRYALVWSQFRGGGSPHTDASLAAIRAKHLPPMKNGEVGILVESRTHFAPSFAVGLAARNLQEVTIVRPRFVPQLCWSSRNDGPWDGSALTC